MLKSMRRAPVDHSWQGEKGEARLVVEDIVMGSIWIGTVEEGLVYCDHTNFLCLCFSRRCRLMLLSVSAFTSSDVGWLPDAKVQGSIGHWGCIIFHAYLDDVRPVAIVVTLVLW